MSIYDFRQDLREGMTIEDALVKHNLTFKEACRLCKSHMPSNNDNYHNIYLDKHNKKFFIEKHHNGKTVYYGSYDDLDVAVMVRDFVEKQDWSKKGLKEFLDSISK